MGNIEAHDFAPVRADERKVLNLGRKVSPKQYVKHLNGDPHEACLTELPWGVRDSVSLYEAMTVSFNAITEMPVELPLRLPHLSRLDLSHNQLQKLPESFGLLFHLREIQLQHNKLNTLPSSFVHLVKLEKVDMSYNELRLLPETMGSMESLSRLSVVHNKLRTLPLSLGAPGCPVRLLMAQQNRLDSPPQAICEEGSAPTLDYLRRQFLTATDGIPTGPSIPLNQFPRHSSNKSSLSVSNPHSAQIQYIQEQTDTANVTASCKVPLLPPLDATTLTPFQLRDRIIGMVYGAAIGDAVGISCRWMIDDEVEFYYGNEEFDYSRIVQDEHRVLWRQGDWTDNFDMFLLVLESLVSWGGVVDELEFSRRLRTWVKQGFPELGDAVGVVTSETVHEVVQRSNFTSSPHLTASILLKDKNLEKFAVKKTELPETAVSVVTETENQAKMNHCSNHDQNTSGLEDSISSDTSKETESNIPAESDIQDPTTHEKHVDHFYIDQPQNHTEQLLSNHPDQPSQENVSKSQQKASDLLNVAEPVSPNKVQTTSNNPASPSKSHSSPTKQSSPQRMPHLRRLSSTSPSLPSLIRCSHQEITQKLVYIAPRQKFGVDNGAIVRTAILGVPNFHKLEEVEGNAVRICRATHADEKCVASCVLVSLMIASILQGKLLVAEEDELESNTGQAKVNEGLLASLFQRASTYITDQGDREEFLAMWSFRAMSSLKARQPLDMSHTYLPLQAALVALHWTGDFRSLIWSISRLAGDSSSNATVAGAVLGAARGYSVMPPDLLTGLRKRQVTWLDGRVNHLLDIMGMP